MLDGRKQAVTGVTPPQLGEAIIREAWPGVEDVPALAHLAQLLMRTIVLAPLGWLLLFWPFFKKVLPVFAKRYTLTNRRIMIRRGLKRVPSGEVALTDIEDVRIEPGSISSFYRTANLEIIAKGQVALRLTAVDEPEGFRRTILNARIAWAKAAAAASTNSTPAAPAPAAPPAPAPAVAPPAGSTQAPTA